MIKKGSKVLCKNVVLRKSTLSKATGLMFRFKLDDEAHLFVLKKPRRADLHMFFVFTSIDVICLNKNFEIVDLKQNFKPFTFFIGKKSSFVLEVPKGFIFKHKLKIKDKLKINYSS